MKKINNFKTIKIIIDEIEDSITGTRQIYETDMNPENENESSLYIELVKNLSSIEAKVDVLYRFLMIFFDEGEE